MLGREPSLIQRDYIDRLIQQCAEALSRMLQHRRAGQHDAALREFSDAADRVLGSIRPLVERMEADTAVEFAGPGQLDRIRLYAALLSEEGRVHQARGDSARAYLRGRRSLELYAAAALAGAPLDRDDLERIAALTRTIDVAELDARHRDLLRRLTGG